MDLSVKQIRDRLLDQDICEWCHVLMTYLLLACLIAFFGCTYQIGWVFTAERHFTLGEPFKVCEQPLGNRCDTHYEVILPDQQREVFKPYGFEFRDGVLHYGLKLDKARYSFTYALDDQRTAWPYLWTFGLTWVMSAAGLVAWALLGGPRHLGRAMWRGEYLDDIEAEPAAIDDRQDRRTTITTKALWLVSLLNAAMMAGVLVYGLGNIPFDAYKGVLKWFGLGLFLSALALSFDYLAGVDALSEFDKLDGASRRRRGKVGTVLTYGVLAAVVFVIGIISTVSLVKG